jgi:hypothetical protein
MMKIKRLAAQKRSAWEESPSQMGAENAVFYSPRKK